jgi:hypothetical protein
MIEVKIASKIVGARGRLKRREKGTASHVEAKIIPISTTAVQLSLVVPIRNTEIPNSAKARGSNALLMDGSVR